MFGRNRYRKQTSKERTHSEESLSSLLRLYSSIPLSPLTIERRALIAERINKFHEVEKQESKRPRFNRSLSIIPVISLSGK